MKYALWAILSLPFSTATLGPTPAKSTPTSKNPGSFVTGQENDFRTYIELLRSNVTKNRVQIIGQVMQLDAGNAAKFWPIYSEFEAECKKFDYGTIALILNYAVDYDEITPEVADQFASKLLDIEQDRSHLKRRFYQRVKAALDPNTAAKFIQVENQIERILDLQIVSQVPVVELPQSSRL